MISITAIILLILATTTGAAGIILMKKGSMKLEINKIYKNTPLIYGIVLFGFSTLFFITSLNYGELHILYSLTGLTYVWLLILANKYLKEPITITKITGTVLIVAGIALLSI